MLGERVVAWHSVGVVVLWYVWLRACATLFMELWEVPGEAFLRSDAHLLRAMQLFCDDIEPQMENSASNIQVPTGTEASNTQPLAQ